MKFLSNGSLFWRFTSSRVKNCNRQHFSIYLLDAANRDTTGSKDDIFVKSSLSKVNHLSCGYGFTIASSCKQSLLVSGVNTTSQLGLPSTKVSILRNFKEIKLPLKSPNSKILDISCGRLHTIVLTSEGLFASGCNRLGQCGLGDIKETGCFTKIPWFSDTPIKQVVCGLDHTLLLMNDRSIWSSGWGADGQTGLDHTDKQQIFAVIKKGFEGVQIKKIASKGDTCLALSDCGVVFSWGNSEHGQVGFSTEETLIATPTKISALENIVDIAVGNSVGLALTVEGNVLSWGYGVLGNSPEPCFSALPQKVTYFDERIVSIDCGLHFYVALTESGKLYTWGRMGYLKDSGIPKQVALPSKVVHVSCGIDHMGVFTENYRQ